MPPELQPHERVEVSAGPDTRLACFDWQDRYSSSRQDLVREFFGPALNRSLTYDRATGYFRSTVYSLIADEVRRFVSRNGRMRLLCSPEMSRDDIKALEAGVREAEVVGEAALRELDLILAHPLGAEPARILANLVAGGVLEIRFAVNARGHGIFHDKVGVFSDSDNAVSFSGSINESWSGWHPLGNHESFEVFRSWEEVRRVEAHVAYFRALWDGDEDGVDVLGVPEAFRERLLREATENPRADLEQPRPKRSVLRRRRLFDHQRDALACWERRGRRGVLKHATGSGKTLTALNAIRDWLATGRPALVLVPSRLLLNQWTQEADEELGHLDPGVLLAGDGNDDWRKGGMLRLHTQPRGGPRLVIATMQTAASPEFLRALGDTSDLLVVADEAHRLGSQTYRRCMEVDAPARLALSATPERAGDAEGTSAIFDYFGDVLEPVFTLADAIGAKRLVPYVYSTTLVTLNADETQEWIERTIKIRQIYAQEADADSGSFSASPFLKHLLIQRARIAKSAASKIQAACEIVRRDYQRGEHWLLYCADQHQLRAVMDDLRTSGIEPLEYHSAMEGDQSATLAHYRRAGGVLVSIKCLDEGVDIPDISHAVILASSRNPREFIQRRGRVLRIRPGKDVAYLHDLVVVPPAGEGDEFDGLVVGEIARAHEFARGAVNPEAALQLHRLCIELGIDPDVLSKMGAEDDEPNEEL
jgi:superfamily II DNA or RNA helicase